jgi:hypothetical protein
MIHFTLYSRSYCHLCDDMLQQLQTFNLNDLFTVDVIDVDADDALVALYDELVPVLFGQRDGNEPVQLCHYFLDVPRLQIFLGNTSS